MKSSTETCTNDNKKDVYITGKEAREILGLSPNMMKGMEKYGLIAYKGYGKGAVYKREEIEFFKAQQDHIGDRYLTKSMAIQQYKDRYPNMKYCLSIVATKIRLPLFCRNKNRFNNNDFIYDREEIEQFISEHKHNTHKILPAKTDLENFHMLLNMEREENKLTCLDKTDYTIKAWMEYADEKLKVDSKASRESRDKKIKVLVNSTLYLDNLLKSSGVMEVYLLTTDQINDWFYSVSNENIRICLNSFFKKVILNILEQCAKVNVYSRCFDHWRIIPHNSIMFTKRERKTGYENMFYSKETYITTHAHLANIPFHIERAIESKTVDECVTYLSTWLYCLLHMNNVLHNKDILEFPRINLKNILDDLKIDNIGWFIDNIIKDEYIQKVYSMFFYVESSKYHPLMYKYKCSNTLSSATITAILMLECYWNYHCEEEQHYEGPIMVFRGSKYNKPTPVMLKKCFEGCEMPDFTFSSIRMCNTVEKLMLDNMTSGYKDFIIDSENQYIRQPIDYFENISKEIFLRGEFGYIINSLLDKMNEVPEDGTNRTDHIKKLIDLFGDSFKVELTYRMIRHFQMQNNGMRELFYKKSFQECIDYVSTIYMNDLPYTIERIQCLSLCTNKDCSKLQCNRCKYSIPSTYTLRELCVALQNDFDDYFTKKDNFEKKEVSTSIHRMILLFIEAINLFGKEYTYSFLDISKEEFLDKFWGIPEPEDIMV